jgi:site-specific recombinase XerD
MASYRRVETKGGKVRYRVRVRTNGYSVSSTHGNRREAERWAVNQEKKALLSRCSAEAQAKARTVGDMISKYLVEVLPNKKHNTQLSQAHQLEYWSGLLGAMSIADVRTPQVAEAKTILRPRSNSTINAYLSALSHVYTMAIKEWEWCETNPVKNVWRLPEGNARTRFLSDSERGKLLFYCRVSSCSVLHTIVVVTLSTGPRKSEVRSLKFSDYNPHLHEVYLDETKNGERRRVALFGMARDLMAKAYAERKPGQIYFFPSPHDARRPIDFRYSWEKVLERAQIENFCFHDLRHSAASYLAWQGATLQDIQEILGHKNIGTTRKYTHLTRSRTDGLVERMNRICI